MLRPSALCQKSGGLVSSSKAKTLLVARTSIEQFFLQHQDVYFLTFTEPGRAEGETLWTKDEAEVHFKPFRDLCSRRGIALLVIWERQKRGSWHPHCLIDRFLDINWVRSWMVSRGWGRQMRVEWLTRHTRTSMSGGVLRAERYHPGMQKVIRYLTKYLSKSVHSTAGCDKKKVFGGSRDSKAGSTAFKWAPWVKAGAYLYAAGCALFFQLNGHRPSFRDMNYVIRLGVEDTGWADYDPLWEFGFPSG